nr:MAG TPA: hypothetical protein [Caudoviricetes sp.]
MFWPRCGILSLGLCPLWLYLKSQFHKFQGQNRNLLIFVAFHNLRYCDCAFCWG